MGRLANRIAIVTGGANGIGEGIALEFAAEGAGVAVVDLDFERAKSVAACIERQGAAALALQADVSNELSVASVVAATVQRFGGLHILINNAGIDPRYPCHEMSVGQWDHVQAVNLRSCFLCARAAFPHFRANGSGKIVNIASVTFWRGRPKNLVHYIASKGGIIGLTRALACDWGEFNIEVNAISPGAVETEREKQIATPEMLAELVAMQALPRRVLPRHIARTAVFLASSDSDTITGQTLNVDAGLAMH